VPDLDPEDRKLVTLARAARARSNAAEGAAVRDGIGRTYAAATVALPSLCLSALQLAVAMAVSSGADSIGAAAVVGADGTHDAAPPRPVAAGAGLGDAGIHPDDLAVVREVGGGAIPIYLAATDGAVGSIVHT
jgi:hypothetical protein